ncbi:Zona pellucida sperm-binding protein 3 [Oryzias melastigma]|uniref:Zona pellucida sperm-binding protein 3 n=1 Tax=Oryzias melastigma TaxID=30732 RepID=A0A834C3S5_ORYME|nr:Zona pellucida sperm-binding protein 3 [Oryzias melastigma]
MCSATLTPWSSASTADLFAVGAPVDVQELRLGVEHSDYCSATAASDSEYRILVGLEDCGTKHWMTEDSLVYTNLLIYTPLPSLNGVTRMDEAVVPVECQYKRKYSLSSSSLMPTWVPFTSTQAAVETLQFNLRLMTNDWLHERGANTFFLGEPINIEASVRVDHHMGLRLFLTSCVATLEPDIKSDPKYIFIENGCLLDSQLPGSKAHFLPRTRDDKLQLTIDSFKFHNDERGTDYDDESDSDLDFVMKSLEMARTNNTFPIIQYELEHTVTNATASKPDLSDKHDPKK